MKPTQAILEVVALQVVRSRNSTGSSRLVVVLVVVVVVTVVVALEVVESRNSSP